MTKEGKYHFTTLPNVEYINPVEFYFNVQLDLELSMVNSLVEFTPAFSALPDDMKNRVNHRVAVKNHLKRWEKKYNRLMQIEFPETYFDFLECKKKKEQNKILKDFELDTDKMTAILFKAHNDFGFTYSKYRFEIVPSDLKNKIMPYFMHRNDDGSFDYAGYTDLTHGQMNVVLNQRSITLGKFLDKGDIWHAFIYTFDGIRGKEVGNNPHIHYISSAFGNAITRDKVLKEISKGKYNLPPMIHIPYAREDYGKAG